MPLVLALVTALALAIGMGGTDAAESGTGPLGGPAGIAIVALAAICGAIMAIEFVVLARHGGGLTARPDGLAFRWGRRTMLVPWPAVAGAAVEGRSSGRGAYDVLAIRFHGGGYRWPRAFSLWFSTPRCLCISPLILEPPAAVVVEQLDEARLLFAATGAEADREANAWVPAGRPPDGPIAYAEPLRPRPRWRRTLRGRLVAIVLLGCAAMCGFWLVRAVLALDFLAVVPWLVLGLGLAFFGVVFWFGATDIFDDE